MPQESVHTYDGQGNLIASSTVEVPAETVNEPTVRQKLRAAVAVLEANHANWPMMTSAQKDTANRQAQRALALLCRLVARSLDSEGPV